jgi:hypothetical protein
MWSPLHFKGGNFWASNLLAKIQVHMFFFFLFCFAYTNEVRERLPDLIHQSADRFDLLTNTNILPSTYIGFFTGKQHPLMRQGPLIMEYSPSHLDTPHSVGLLWTSDQPGAETSTWQHTTLTTTMFLAGFKPTISAGERPLTHALKSAATAIGCIGY